MTPCTNCTGKGWRCRSPSDRLRLALDIADYVYVLQTGRIALDLHCNDEVREICLGTSRAPQPA
jgi:hypothetical protein